MVDLYYALYGNKINCEGSSSRSTKVQKADYKQLFVPASDSTTNISSLKRESDDICNNYYDESSHFDLEPLNKKMKTKHNENLLLQKKEMVSNVQDLKSKIDKDKIKKKKKDKKKHKHRHKHKHNKEKEKVEKKDKKILNAGKSDDVLK